VAGALCALAVVAAGTGVEAVGRKPVTHTVTIDGARFSPAELTVHPGDTIVWVNKDILAHTATSAKGGFDSKVIQPGASWRYKVPARARGESPYTCSFHPMNGLLRIK
jgi:plastocyanin